MSFFAQLMTWTQKTFEPLGALGLFILAFMESSFFPIPPDVLLIILSLAEPNKALWFALVCTIGSVIGGIFGYIIGYAGKEAVLKRIVSQRKIEKVHKMFEKYEAWAIGIAGFTPIPYKVFTISAGAFYINFRKFVIASLLSRGARFAIEAVLIMYFGKAIVGFIDTYFNWITLIGVAVIAAFYLFYKKRRKIS